ncbi:uncharacterized protein DSM5745_07893 [Aspergillus mulundensis]|uniref:Uncharacterized protein n=1 Tax=Aspergillus mulundensis TaxID=1810919 RepID=A0A3D8RFT2_9EURO|nr:hypothetical protein DSM5745_07893 [Aspergillus mulundensis]RDW72721.1 hypothetical protein DSM5745_07893 [Aspergillus mulundensis]
MPKNVSFSPRVEYEGEADAKAKAEPKRPRPQPRKPSAFSVYASVLKQIPDENPKKILDTTLLSNIMTFTSFAGAHNLPELNGKPALIFRVMYTDCTHGWVHCPSLIPGEPLDIDDAFDCYIKLREAKDIIKPMWWDHLKRTFGITLANALILQCLLGVKTADQEGRIAAVSATTASADTEAGTEHTNENENAGEHEEAPSIHHHEARMLETGWTTPCFMILAFLFGLYVGLSYGFSYAGGAGYNPIECLAFAMVSALVLGLAMVFLANRILRFIVGFRFGGGRLIAV